MEEMIEKLSVEYGLANPVIHYDADGNTYNDAEKPAFDFEAGAEAVLEIIKKTYHNEGPLAVLAMIKNNMSDGEEYKEKSTLTARCFGFQSGEALFSIHLPAKDYLVGSEIKVKIIEEDEQKGDSERN